MHDSLPKKIRTIESGIINLDDSSGMGTHWVCYIKKGEHVMYMDSFGNLKPPLRIVKYFKSSGSVSIEYNRTRFQDFNSYNCGHLCLQFLKKYSV